MGFALLSRHFEKTHVAGGFQHFCRTKGRRFRCSCWCWCCLRFSTILPRRSSAGPWRPRVRGKVHIGYLAAIVAASNAGGSGSVIGDTTTTMMWIDGVSPFGVLEAYIAVLRGSWFSGFQRRYNSSVIRRSSSTRHRTFTSIGHGWGSWGSFLSWRSGQRLVNVKFSAEIGFLPFIGVSVWERFCSGGCAGPIGKCCRRPSKAPFSCFRCSPCVDDAVREIARPIVALRVGTGIRVGGFRQHPADRARAQAGWVRLGLPSVHDGVRRFDGVVRLERGSRPVEPLPGSEIGRPMASARLVCRGVVYS